MQKIKDLYKSKSLIQKNFQINMTNNLKEYYEQHPLRWAIIFFCGGVTAALGCSKYFYYDPAEREMTSLRGKVNEIKSSPEWQNLSIDMQRAEKNANEWMNHSKKLEEILAKNDSNALLNASIYRLNLDKKATDKQVDMLLSPSINSGNEPSKMNILRAEESRRQSAQIQEQILGLIAKVSR